jgi:signal recognition particle receptor subunit beta
MGLCPATGWGRTLEDDTVVVVSYSGKEINAKLVYYGAGLSGKTTNLESIYEAVPETSRGKMVSMKTQSDRTLFFDLLPLDLGEIMGFKTRFLLYTVPGQVFYNATRKLVLKGADAVVFVADSGIGKMEENKESLANLKANLAEYGLKVDEMPFAIQYNKRDLPNVYSVEELNKELNPDGRWQTFEAVATKGVGVFETFRGVSHLLMQKVTRELRRSPHSGRGAKAEEAEAKAEPTIPKATDPISPAQRPAPPGTREASQNSDLQAEPTAFDYGREVDFTGSRTDPSRDDMPARPSINTNSAGDEAGMDDIERAPRRTPVEAAPIGSRAEPPSKFIERTISLNMDGARGAAAAQAQATAPARAVAAAVTQEIVVRVPRTGAREFIVRIIVDDAA